MTTKRQFFCNMCRDEIKPGDGVGIFFTSNGMEFKDTNNLFSAENHLCFKCIDATWDLSEKLHSKRSRYTE